MFNFLQGLELRTAELEPILATLSKPHAEAIKQRVRALNQTVRGRTKNRQKRKPDIRDVFRDFDVSTTKSKEKGYQRRWEEEEHLLEILSCSFGIHVTHCYLATASRSG